MYCRYCGKETGDKETICSTCARELGKKKKTNKKSNKKNTAIIIACVSLVLIGVIFLLVRNLQSPEDAVSENLDSIVNQQQEPINSDSLGSKIAEEIISNTSYQVLSANKDTAIVLVTAPDVYSLYMTAISDSKDTVPTSKEEYDSLINATLEYVNRKLCDNDYELKEYEVTIQLADDYQIEMNYELANALYGGLLQLQSELSEQYIGGDIQ